MNWDLDREIRLIDESQNNSLYPWSLQEFSSDGKKIGLENIPWRWDLNFMTIELSHNKSIRIKQSHDSESETKKCNIVWKQRPKNQPKSGFKNRPV